jgi:hypothetical protein
MDVILGTIPAIPLDMVFPIALEAGQIDVEETCIPDAGKLEPEKREVLVCNDLKAVVRHLILLSHHHGSLL